MHLPILDGNGSITAWKVPFALPLTLMLRTACSWHRVCAQTRLSHLICIAVC